MQRIHAVSAAGWGIPYTPAVRQAAVRALEDGSVLFFPGLAFLVSPAEKRFLDPAILNKSKNVSYNPANDKLGGTLCDGGDAENLKAMIRRYADAAQGLLERLLMYGPELQRERTSLRPAAVEGRVTSWRKDDTRLHVDAFPSSPVYGRRLLRLFCNVNPQGRPRTWRVGEPFPDVANRFWTRLTTPRWLNMQLLALVRATRGVRSDYDHYMLQLHDAMKADDDYQRSAPQEQIDFPAASAWACFTDQVSHAALAGQHQFEQTFSLPVEAMQRPETSPLRVLERRAGRLLITPTTTRKAA